MLGGGVPILGRRDGHIARRADGFVGDVVRPSLLLPAPRAC